LKIDQSFTFGRTTKKKLDNYLSGSKKWQGFCKGKEVIKEFIASFDNEEDQVSLEYWYNHYVYPDNQNCWSRKSPSIVLSAKISKIQKEKAAAGLLNLQQPYHRENVSKIVRQRNLDPVFAAKRRSLVKETWEQPGKKEIQSIKSKANQMVRIKQGTHNFIISQPSIGTVWMNNGEKTIRVAQDRADEFLTLGWAIGRIRKP